MGFAVWLGRTTAAVAGLLAVVWVYGAQPDREGPRAIAAQAVCRANYELRADTANQRGDFTASARARMDINTCQWLDGGWDGAALTRAGIASLAAVALVLLSAMAAQMGRRPEANPPPSYTDMAHMIALEKGDAWRLHQEQISEATARERVERRLRERGVRV